MNSVEKIKSNIKLLKSNFEEVGEELKPPLSSRQVYEMLKNNPSKEEITSLSKAVEIIFYKRTIDLKKVII